MKFDHIGIVVPSLKAGREHLAAVFRIADWSDEITDEVNGVYAQFGRDGSGICYEVIAPLGEDSPMARVLVAKDRILNHVAYLVPDLDAAAARLRKARCMPLGAPKPGIAFGGNRLQFFISPLAFILELIEAPAHEHMLHSIGIT